MDTDSTDDFSGSYNDLSDKPTATQGSIIFASVTGAYTQDNG
jgi:hypothetical protein